LKLGQIILFSQYRLQTPIVEIPAVAKLAVKYRQGRWNTGHLTTLDICSRSVVVKLFCVRTPFRICSKTCTPLPCTKIYYCKSAKFKRFRRCL